MPRIYQAISLKPQQQLELSNEAHQHLAKVLRAKVDDEINLFNGDGFDYPAQISAITKKSTQVEVLAKQSNQLEADLDVHLLQAISRSDRMDFVVQKATELGVKTITPVISERSNIKQKHEHLVKKQQHWQKVAISACEQCGRSVVPEIKPVRTINELITAQLSGFVLVTPTANSLSDNINHPQPHDNGINLLVGPEGGLSPTEISKAINAGLKPLTLGPRVLRTETATIVGLAVLGMNFGDLNGKNSL